MTRDRGGDHGAGFDRGLGAASSFGICRGRGVLGSASLHLNSFLVGEGDGFYAWKIFDLPGTVGSGRGLCNSDPMYMSSGATTIGFTWNAMDKNATPGQTSKQEDWDSMERVDSHMLSTWNVVG